MTISIISKFRNLQLERRVLARAHVPCGHIPPSSPRLPSVSFAGLSVSSAAPCISSAAPCVSSAALGVPGPRCELRDPSLLPATCHYGEGKRRLRLRQVGAVAENPRELGTSLGPRTSDLGTLRGRTCMLVTGRLRVYARDWAAPRLCSKLGGLARMLAAARLRDWNTDWSADWSTLEH